ncbi:MAG: hypothetical protein JXI43_14615 [Tissierellales bacterium]|nr:hypothetical protein [Tissierellales bacterium]
MSEIKDEKNAKLIEIKNLIHDFCEEYLNSELEGYCFKLCDTLGRKRKINILRSKSEQWAASIIYVIARLNFLFDKKNEYYIMADIICDYFYMNKSTTGNKATQIEQICNLSMGTEGYCSKKISDMFIFYETEDGFIIPKSMFDSRIIEVQFTDDVDENTIRKLIEPEESIQEKRQREKEEHFADLKERAKKRNDNENQLGLFDN